MKKDNITTRAQSSTIPSVPSDSAIFSFFDRLLDWNHLVDCEAKLKAQFKEQKVW
jgi:hypothetical protein